MNAGAPSLAPSAARLPHSARNVRARLVERYLKDLHDRRFEQAYVLLDTAERAYYRHAANLQSIYDADAYRIGAFSIRAAHGDDPRGQVYFVRETAGFRDHAHDVDLTVTATVPIGVVAENGQWRIKDPGHPWRAYASRASGDVQGVVVRVKKLSFFARRIEAVLTIANRGSRPLTVLAYGRSVLRDSGGRVFAPIVTRDWSLTDKRLFEGLRLPPDGQYTGILAFATPPLRDEVRKFRLTLAPLLTDGADLPFAIDVAIAPAAPTR